MEDSKIYFRLLNNSGKSPYFNAGYYDLFIPKSHILGPGELCTIELDIRLWIELYFNLEFHTPIDMASKNMFVHSFTSANEFIQKKKSSMKSSTLKIILENKSSEEYEILEGTRIAKMTLVAMIKLDVVEFKTKDEVKEFEDKFMKGIIKVPSNFDHWFNQQWCDNKDNIINNYLSTVEGEEALEKLKEYKKTDYYKKASKEDRAILESIYLLKQLKSDKKYDSILVDLDEVRQIDKVDAM